MENIRKKLNQLVILALLVGCFIFLFTYYFNNFSVYAFESENDMETRSLCYPTVDEAFDDSSVIVVMDNDTGGINKVHNKEFFGDFEIASIKDLTYIDGNIEDRKFLDQENFKQILQLKLPINSKENVISVIRQLDNVEGIIWAGPNYYEQSTALQEYASDENYYDLWGLNGTYGINAEAAWDYTTGSNKIRVGIIDTGIANHPYLNANVVSGYDFVNKNAITNDDPTGHGTHVAGIIGASSNISNGVVGVNLDVELVPLQVVYWEEKDQEWYFDYAAITQAITYATSNTHVLNYSGGGTGEYPPFRDSLSNYNGVFVCAAGNGGKDKISDNNDDIPYYPANYSYGETYSNKVISVGAITKSGERRVDSNYGTNSVSIYAPGDGILSTVPYSIDSSGYQYWGGTSMAAPHVAGVAALMLSVNPNLTGEELKTAIINNADEITISIPDGSTQKVKKLNAFKAVSSVAFKTDASGYTITDINFEPSKELTIPDSINGKSITGLGAGLFNDCTALTTVTLPDSVTSIGENAFYNTGIWNEAADNGAVYADKWCVGYKGTFTELNLREDTVGISDYAFNGCTGLQSFTLPDSVTSIGENAFYNTGIWNEAADNGAVYADKWCVGYKGTFTELNLREDTVGISDYAFNGCTGLQSVTLPESDGVILAGEFIFYGCTGLKTVFVSTDEQVLEYRTTSGWETYRYRIFNRDRVLNENSSVGTLNNSLIICYNVVSDEMNHIISCSNPNIQMTLATMDGTDILTGYNKIIARDLSSSQSYSIRFNWDVQVDGSFQVSSYICTQSWITLPSSWILVTDVENEDPSLGNIINNCELEAIYTYQSGDTWGDICQIIADEDHLGVIFYAQSQEFADLIQYDQLNVMIITGEIGPSIVVTQDKIYNLTGGGGTIERDWYSLGYNLAMEYMNSIGDMNSSYDYIPIVAPSSYRSNVLLLMGMSHVFEAPIRIISSPEEIEQELEVCQFENWIFIDLNILLSELDNLDNDDFWGIFEADGLDISEFSFFGSSLDYQLSLKELSSNVYQYTFEEQLSDIMIELFDNCEFGDVEYEEWLFNASEHWEELQYNPYTNDWAEWLSLWEDFGYPINYETWYMYWSLNWDIKCNGNYDDFWTYWGLNHCALIEQVIIKL